MSTIRDIAKRAGVSTATVSHVNNKSRFVSEETARRVRRAMEELDYRPNMLARSLRRNRSLTLGIVLPDTANPFYAEVGRGIEDTAYQEGYTVFFGSSEDDPKKEADYLRVFREKQVDGIILLTTGKTIKHIKPLVQQRYPLVILDHQFYDLITDYVIADNRQGGALATEHLIKYGHRRIACINTSSKKGTIAERLSGYQEALKANGIPIDRNLIVPGDFTELSGYSAAKKLLLLERGRPTAIFACNDLMAFGVMTAISEAGLHVPEDISVVGFDNIALSAYVSPPLTTVHQPKNEMGCLAAQILIEKIHSKKPIPAQVHLLPTELVIRKSDRAL